MPKNAAVIPSIVPTPEQRIAKAAAEWLDAKQAEQIANERRLAAEQELCALVTVKTEGTSTEEHGIYKIKTVGKLDRKLDAEKLLTMDKKIPAPILQRLVKYTPEVRVSELRYVEENEPAYYAIFADALTTKPAKTSVSVEIK